MSKDLPWQDNRASYSPMSAMRDFPTKVVIKAEKRLQLGAFTSASGDVLHRSTGIDPVFWRFTRFEFLIFEEICRQIQEGEKNGG